MAASQTPVSLLLVVKTQVLIVIVMAYQLYLALSTEVIDDTLKQVERVGSWPVQILNIGLFVLVLGICWLYLQSTRKDLAKLQTTNEHERQEYIDSLRTLVSDTAKIVERNNAIYERIDRRLERLDEQRVKNG
jgi:hypothetical protein